MSLPEYFSFQIWTWDSPVFRDKISEMWLIIFPEEFGLTENLFPPWQWVSQEGPAAESPPKSRGPWLLMDLNLTLMVRFPLAEGGIL